MIDSTFHGVVLLECVHCNSIEKKKLKVLTALREKSSQFDFKMNIGADVVGCRFNSSELSI